MADLFDDLDGAPQASSRPTKFAPKNSKFKPKPKVEKALSEPPPVQEVAPKKEELDIKPPVPIPLESDAGTKSEDAAVKMEVDGELEGAEPSGDAIDLDGEEDHVVREIDVYLTPPSGSNIRLYVLQYPLRPLWRPYELDSRCEEVRVKPATGEVEVDLAIDVDSKNYDSGARATMAKQTLSCSWNPTRRVGYAVGVLKGNKLHLNPIHSVVQLRPSMQPSQSGGSSKKANENGNVDSAIKEGDRVEKKSMGPSKKKNNTSVSINEQNLDEEKCWIPLKYHGARSDLSAHYLQKMIVEEGSVVPFLMSPCEYIKSLCPGMSNENVNSKGPSRRFLQSLPLEERFKTLFLEGPPVHRFDALKHFALDVSADDILSVVQKLAHLVQGFWVPKSSLVYGKDGGLEVLARDYILLLFSRSPVISYAELPQRPQLARAMKDVLKVFAVDRESFSDWRFKEHPDISFMKTHPYVCKEQEEIWKHLEEQIFKTVFGEKKRPGTNSLSKPKPEDRAKTSKDSGFLRSSTAASNKSSMSDETREALPKVLQKVFQTHKVCSFMYICQRLREMAVLKSSSPKGGAKEIISAANGVDTPDELRAIVDQVAFNIHGVYVLKSSPDDTKNDPLRKVVIDLLIAEGPNAKLKKAAIFEAAKMQLKREIQPNEYTKVMNELCVSQGSAWVLKSGDGNPR